MKPIQVNISSIFKMKVYLFWLLVFSPFTVLSSDISPILQSGHTERISFLTLTDEEEYLITGGMDGKVIFWDISSRQQVLSLGGFTGGVSCLDYHKGTNTLVVGTYGNQVQIYDLNKDYYNPIKIYDFVYAASSVAISPDGEMVLAASADFTINVIIGDQDSKHKVNGDVVGLCFTRSGLNSYFGTYDGGIYYMSKAKTADAVVPRSLFTIKESVSDLDVSPNGRYLAIGCNGSNGEPGKVYVYDTKKRKVKTILKDFSPYTGVQNNTIHFLDDQSFYYKNKEGGLSRYQFKKEEITPLLDEIPYSGFHLSQSTKQVIYANGREAVSLNPEIQKSELRFKGYVDLPVRILGQDSQKLIVEYESGIKSWDLHELELSLVKEKFYEDKWPRLDYTRDMSVYAEGNYFRKADGSRIGYFRDYNEPIVTAAFSQNNRYYAFMEQNGNFRFADLSLIHPDSGYFDYGYYTYIVEYRKTLGPTYNKIVFAPHKNEMVLLGKTMEVYDLDALRKESKRFNFRQADFPLPAVYNPNDGYFLTAARREVFDSIAYEGREGYDKEWRSIEFKRSGGRSTFKNVMNGVVYLWDLEELNFPLYFVRDPSIAENADVVALLYDEFDKTIITGYSDGHIAISDATDTVYSYLSFSRPVGHGLKDLTLSEDGSLLYASMDDGGIYLIRKNGLKFICSLIALEDNEFIAMDGEGYYKRSKNTANAIAFWQNGSLSKLSQFDQMFNKPHKVMQELGFVPEQKLALLKRLAAHSDKGAVYSDSIVLPKLRLTDTEKIEYSTSDGMICLKTIATSDQMHLDHMEIWVNGVPMYKEGAEPKAKNKFEWKDNWEVPLQYGENAIKFKAYSKEGVASNEVLVNINCTKEYVKPDLYIAMISVSEYMDASMNLKYAVKDGRDIANVFVQEDGRKRLGFPSRFGEVYIDSFFNGEATRENIIQWKEKLKKSKPEDYVILYVSGHGLLDEDLDFWFATHDIDFEKPAERGMSYEALEDLLVAIPARQKLFLMDACHSGEVIKDDIYIDSTFTTPDGSRGKLVGYVHRGTEVIDLDGEAVNQDEVKQELFSNYISSSGATVISAAAGSSFALESPEWNNGIFTYTVIGGLLNRWADLNQNGEVSVVELSKYVSAKVKEQTDGLQIPNDRQENIENNFRIW